MSHVFSAVASEIQRSAKATGRISEDLGLVVSVAKKDSATCQARGTPDVLTDLKSHAYITKITSRSAPQTRVFLGNPDDEALMLAKAAAEYLQREKVQLLFMDRQMGLHPEHFTHCRTVVTKPYARLLFMWDKLLFKLESSRRGKEPHQTLICVPEWGEVAQKYLPKWANAQKNGGKPLRRILVDAESGITFVLGSDYFGEVKKGHLRMAMHREKALFKKTKGKEGGLGVHAGGKVIRAKDAKSGKVKDLGAIFFGLSGTGKTSLSVHHFWLTNGERVIIRQDDFFVLDKDAKAYGTEDNAYIKTEGLEPEGQPLLYQGAMRESAVLENVYVDPKTRKADFFRYDHPFTANRKCLNGRGIVARSELYENGVKQADGKVDLDSVDMVFFITRRDTIVPPIARLSHTQAAAFFMLGESILTSAADPVRAGQSVREVGTNPFIVGPEGEEGNIFFEICAANPDMKCYLLNTGSFGGRTTELGSGTLADKSYWETVERFSKGIEHPRAGKEMELEVNGKTHRYKVRLVRVEAEYLGERVKDQKKLGELLENVKKGEAKADEIKVYEHALLTLDKITVKDSCTIIREIARGNVNWGKDDYWGYEIASEIPGIELSRFDWKKYYSKEEKERMEGELKKERIEWLAKFPELKRGIREAIR